MKVKIWSSILIRSKNALNRSRLIDKSAGNAWDLSIPGEHFGSDLPIDVFCKFQTGLRK
ncbi:hypothetical protein QUF80_15380 [Desulfococcaceae bacterium HSG8]|nr:hypothetical protein [Desulfococcaceae bacterium HSG8]